MTIASRDSNGHDRVSTVAENGDRGDQPSDKPVKRAKRRSTSHLKAVPETLEEREQLRDDAERYVEDSTRRKPFNKNELEAYGRNC